jgi:hypothetical protein
VLIDDLHLVGVSSGPAEADSPALIDPDAPLASPVTRKPLQVVPWREPEIFDRFRRIQQQKLPQRGVLR